MSNRSRSASRRPATFSDTNPSRSRSLSRPSRPPAPFVNNNPPSNFRGQVSRAANRSYSFYSQTRSNKRPLDYVVISEPTAQIRTSFQGNPILFMKLTALVSVIITTARIFKATVTRSMISPLLALFDRNDKLPISCNYNFEIKSNRENSSKRIFLSFVGPKTVDDKGSFVADTFRNLVDSVSLMSQRTIVPQALNNDQFFNTIVNLQDNSVIGSKNSPKLFSNSAITLEKSGVTNA